MLLTHDGCPLQVFIKSINVQFQLITNEYWLEVFLFYLCHFYAERIKVIKLFMWTYYNHHFKHIGMNTWLQLYRFVFEYLGTKKTLGNQLKINEKEQTN